MKNAILLLTVIIAISVSSCKKQVEEFNMIGTWHIDSYYENGADNTTVFKSVFVNYLITFNATGTYLETYTALGVDVTKGGPWELINDGDDLKLTNQVDSTIRYFHVIEIKASSSQVSEDNGNKEYHLLKN